MIPFVSARGKQACQGVLEVAFAFKDSSSAELFCSMKRRKSRRYGYTQAMKASEDII
jgi:hypothetical protein